MLQVATAEEAGGADRSILVAWVEKQAQAGKRIAGVVTFEAKGRKFVRILSTREEKMLQLNDIGEEELAKMAEHKKHRATESKSTDSAFKSSTVEQTSQAFDRPVCVVGPFVFDDEVLACARRELLTAIENPVDILVVDEIGPLEVKRGEGLEPAFKQCVSSRDKMHIVVIVRPNLWEYFGEVYGCSADMGRMDFAE
mmetsp:Transcript_43195/g.86674  ORF Transcript_43195/g.86674 Transcript_43195/m.86674 type:complete len:197 (-) Transcript_43195:38-628(-)